MENNIKKQGEKLEDKKDINISKGDLIKKIVDVTGQEPIWSNKKFKEMSLEEQNEYKKYRKQIEKSQPNKTGVLASPITDSELNVKIKDENTPDTVPHEDKITGNTQDKARLTEEELFAPILYTTKKVMQDLPTPEEEKLKEKEMQQNKLIQDYITHHNIKSKEALNFAIEHDDKFRKYLEKLGRFKELYTGSHLKTVEEDKERFNEEYKDSKKKKKKKKLKKETNKFEDSRKLLDLEKFRNKKLEKQGNILCFYLRKNGIADPRYVRMDEVGQIKVGGYTYHERDATYRMGKKNDPVLLLMEGALVPLTKETLKEHLGFETAEAQKLVIKGIEQAEVVKMGGLEDHLKKSFAPPKWLIGLGIAIIIGIYAFMGGFS